MYDRHDFYERIENCIESRIKSRDYTVDNKNITLFYHFCGEASIWMKEVVDTPIENTRWVDSKMSFLYHTPNAMRCELVYQARALLSVRSYTNDNHKCDCPCFSVNFNLF